MRHSPSARAHKPAPANLAPDPQPTGFASSIATVAPWLTPAVIVTRQIRPLPTTPASAPNVGATLATILVVPLTLAPGSSGTPVSLVSYAFNPNTLSARVGQPVQLALKNIDAIPHRFAIDGTDVVALLNPGTMQPFEFVFNQPGIYTFACNVNTDGMHRVFGMVGKFVDSR